MSTTAKHAAKVTVPQPNPRKPQQELHTNKAKIAEKNYLQPKPAQGSHFLASKKETGQPISKTNAPDHPATQQAKGQVTDSLDQQMNQVDSQLFQSRAQEQAAPAPAASTVLSRKQREADIALDDSEFYRSMTMVDNTKDTLVEQNIKTVLERRLEEKPSEKTAERLKEKLPMLRDGVYRKDYTPQDLALSRPRYGDANNPYDSFSAKPVDEPINSIHRRDFVAKSKAPGEPVHRDVTKSQQDLVKHLRAPPAGDSMYRVDWAHQADFPYWGVVPPPTSILPNNPKTQADGMPFMGKSTSSDYGNFMGIKDKPITIHRHLKNRSPLGPNIALYSETEYNAYMKAHDPKAKQSEPKYKQLKEAVGPFEGNYQSVYQDYVDHRIGDKSRFDSQALRESALKEKEALIVIASRRVMEDAVLGPKVFDATYS